MCAIYEIMYLPGLRYTSVQAVVRTTAQILPVERRHKLLMSVGDSRILLFVFLFGVAGGAYSQSALTVSPSQLTFEMVAGGPIAVDQSVTISGASGGWTATVSNDAPWLTLSATSGTSTPASVTLGLVKWRAQTQAAGEYSGTVTITPEAQGAPVTVSITWKALDPISPPKFNYIAGPQGCSRPDGYADDALCEVPGLRPPGAFTPPSPGGSYVDANFGAKVTILTEPTTYHAYSTPSPMSAHNKYVIAFRDGFYVWNVADGKQVSGKIPANWSVMWDAYDDEVLYFIDGATVKKYDLRSGQTTVMVDYSAAPEALTQIKNGGTGDTSSDNWIAFWAPDQQKICALDLNRIKTYCADYSAVPGPAFTFLDFVLISKGIDRTSGKRYVLLMANPALAVFSVNLTAGRLDFEYRGPELPEKGNGNGICEAGETCLAAPHSDVFQDSKGIQYLVSTLDTRSPCERGLNTYQLNKGTGLIEPVELGGGRKKVMTVFRCGAMWTGDHIGCAKQAPYCAVSISNNDGVNLRDPSDQAPMPRGPHTSEVMVMKENGAEVRRLVEHRSVLFKGEPSNGYWSTPRAALSNDGTMVIVDSNFGFPDQQRVVLVETGWGQPVMAENGVVNAASFQQNLAPNSFATIFGTGLAKCIASSQELPFPDTLCGSRVTANGAPCRYSYASPMQLNVVLPESVAPQQPLELVVSVEGRGASERMVAPGEQVGRAAPAIFGYMLDDQILRAVIQNSDFSVNGPPLPGTGFRPLRHGEAGRIYANALGPTDPPVSAGEAAPVEPLARTTANIDVYVNDVRQTTSFSGLTPTLANLYQIDFKLDPSTPIREHNIVWLNVDGVESPRLEISIAPAN